MKYKIIRDHDRERIERAITQYLGDGWSLSGGVFICFAYGTIWHSQAMVLPADSASAAE